MPRFATLDVGTNTVLLLVAEADGARFRPVVERMEITRLGRGVDQSGHLAEAAVDDTVAAIARFAGEARALGAAEIACVATSAARDAANGAAFLARVQREAGLAAEIIDGDLEAQLSYEAAERDLGVDRPLVVLDIGGGSTEIIFGERSKVSYKRSFDLGSVRLTERHISHDPPSDSERAAIRASVDQGLAALPAPPAGFALVGVAGTVTTISAVARGIDPYDADRVHLSRLTISRGARRARALLRARPRRAQAPEGDAREARRRDRRRRPHPRARDGAAGRGRGGGERSRHPLGPALPPLRERARRSEPVGAPND